MLHYKFINSHLIFVSLVDVSFSHANSGKQTLLVGIYIIYILYIIYIILYIYIFIHTYIYIYIYIYIYRNFIETVNPTMYMITYVYTQ